MSDKFEVVNFGPYRFIGKTVYLRRVAPSAVWEAVFKDGKDWVLAKLDEMSEYATEETHTVALYNWSRYEEKECLQLWQRKCRTIGLYFFSHALGRSIYKTQS